MHLLHHTYNVTETLIHSLWLTISSTKNSSSVQLLPSFEQLCFSLPTVNLTITYDYEVSCTYNTTASAYVDFQLNAEMSDPIGAKKRLRRSLHDESADGSRKQNVHLFYVFLDVT